MKEELLRIRKLLVKPLHQKFKFVSEGPHTLEAKVFEGGGLGPQKIPKVKFSDGGTFNDLIGEVSTM